MTKANRAAAPPVRCAVYTRKSTEEGLQQAFNSLDAQREAAEAYIKSQAHAGWVCLPDRFDDGGFTGGNMDRPALQRLLADVDAGKVDAVVVYKVDRLSRSLLDFARIIGLFETRGVAFVSVTQQFNTSTSMGRLVLNVLLSFAQFEREIILERTRDKVAATRKKGKWAGGHPPLGYNVDAAATRLVVDEAEAARVRAVFELFLEHQALIPVVTELRRRVWSTKRWTTKGGPEREGRPFDRTNLRRLLTNVTYTGRVRYRGQLYPGEHAGIVDADLFERVQQALCPGRTPSVRTPTPFRALLSGVLRCGACGCAMTPAHSWKKPGKRYSYYACINGQKRGRAACPAPSVPAAQVEAFVTEQVRRVGGDPALLDRLLTECRVPKSLGPATLRARWESVTTREPARVVRMVVERVEYDGVRGKAKLTFRPDGLQTFLRELAEISKGDNK